MVAVKTRDVQLTKVAPLAPAAFGAWCTVRIEKRKFTDWVEVIPLLGQPVTPLLSQAVQKTWGGDAQLIDWTSPEPDDSDEAMPQRSFEKFAEF
ncbi:MAG: hypothetical protein HC852_01800 [Acaryochloridaceae cyanobacterium RU_4_10]|nr:hypothetical protein [Acaryochloridaceae cyanobacterium RU_4_10]